MFSNANASSHPEVRAYGEKACTSYYAVDSFTPGIDLGIGDCYNDVKTYVAARPDYDLVTVSPHNEEDGLVADASGCSWGSGAHESRAGESSSDWTCDDDSDSVPDPLEYVDYTARAYIAGYEGSNGTIPLLALKLKMDYTSTSPEFLKQVMDFGLGSFFDGTAYHYYYQASCWTSAGQTIRGKAWDNEEQGGGSPWICNDLPPSGTTLVLLGGNPSPVICSKGIVRSPSGAPICLLERAFARDLAIPGERTTAEGLMPSCTRLWCPAHYPKSQQ